MKEKDEDKISRKLKVIDVVEPVSKSFSTTKNELILYLRKILIALLL
jgi:hypothetical protein